MPDTFGSYHQRRTDDGRARTAREAQDIAAFDQAAPAAAGCFVALALLVAMVAAALGVALG